MRFVRMLGLAGTAALFLPALFGVSSAPAGSSLLCESNTVLAPSSGECTPPALTLSLVLTLTLALTSSIHFLSAKVNLDESKTELTTDEKVTLLNSTLNVKCQVLLSGIVLLGLVTNGPVVIHVAANELVYTSCTFACTATTIKGGLLLLLKTGSELAELTGHDFELRLNCFGFFDCYYNFAALTGHYLGPLNADTGGKGHLTYAETALNLVKGESCPAVAKLDALFQSLAPLYIRS